MGLFGPNTRKIDGHIYECVGEAKSEEEIEQFKAWCSREGVPNRVIPKMNCAELYVRITGPSQQQRQ
jgi:hypothetical protein